ncbi:TetR/AcrR family transcriptional regulator [Tessaracoccus sp. MC1756]|uniref:TetR/AcrR family transcriptional regulator n=1 Tax=Tessaracoccus sp. MC1756 TaxID=2760311 RepID=UPI0015FFD6BB|nr:TetR/AcrR family transcriptional regulator [Tessaracoccus sp. MC1756]MBB1510272.1 helix-turn-helix transcriptional regulator [Tessaracoccus sp. MC1756]
MRADALARRRRILDEARHLFAGQGVAVPLEAVAQSAEVGIATLYRNYPDRDALVIAVMLDLLADIDAAVAAAAEGLDADPEATWAGLVDRLVALEVGALSHALSGQVADLPAEVTEAQERSLAGVSAVLKALSDRRAVSSDLSAVEFIAAMAILTRPQPEAIHRAAPGVVARLVAAFVGSTRP